MSVGVAKPLGAGAEKGLPGFGLVIRRDSEEGTGSKDLTLYTYDKYNRLTRMKSEDTTATYRYNAQGYRTEKTVNGATTRYLYEGDKVVLETDKNNNQKAFQVYGTNLLYRAVAESDGIEAEEYYYLYNAHGDVTGLIDAKGNIAATYDYDAFGTILSETGSANNNIKYAGYQHDKETGLYYLNARYYDSTIARFITEDTYRGQANDPLSLNLYSYCHNDPILYVDPSGHVIVIAGTKEEQQILLEHLQRLTDHSLIIKDGFVTINKYTTKNIKYEKGNELITRMIENKYVTTIKVGDINYTTADSIKNAQKEGQGSGSTIYIILEEQESQTVDPKTKNVSLEITPV